MDNILEVKKLKLSFRTSSGTLKAVRNISFDLERGKTLAIVGESGSGKSVTSRAIMGILAGNAIIEGGEILYDGKDLLKIHEDDMYKIRGDKIAMIFQDPLSSLNPIVKIGKQITEAMLLKNKANRREAKSVFNGYLALLKDNMIAVAGKENADKVQKMIRTFDDFNIKATHLENSYNHSDSVAEELIAAIEELLFLTSKKQKVDVKSSLGNFASRLRNINDPFMTANYKEKLTACAAKLNEAKSGYHAQEDNSLPQNIIDTLEGCKSLLQDLIGQERPNFFRIGYYALMNPNEDLAQKPVAELNKLTLDYLNKNFMNEFLELAEKAVKHSHTEALEMKKALMEQLAIAKEFYLGDFTKREGMKFCKNLSAEVEASIDRLEIIKDSAAYTFRSSLSNAIEQYFYHMKRNPKEEKRFERQTNKRERLIARGKKIDWQVLPNDVYDTDELKENITVVIDRLTERYNAAIAGAS